MDKVDKVSGEMIGFLEELKMDLLNSAGESTSANNQDPNKVVWRSYDKSNPCQPSRLNLYAIKDYNNVEAIKTIFGSENLLKPSSDGKELWNKLNKFRKTIVELSGTYSWRNYDYSVDQLKEINNYANAHELNASVRKMIESNPVNKYEDVEILIKLYMTLTKPEKVAIP